tara:strand:- start:31403 stop:31954 length:552 start_codon:yes stop_codon:yes gene_type:complete
MKKNNDHDAIVHQGVHPYPAMFNTLAIELGKLRSKLSSNVYKEGTEKFRGSQEGNISTKGVLGELIARHYLSEKKVQYTAADLVDVRPVVEPDIITYKSAVGCKLDIKTMGKGESRMMINYAAHNNPDKTVAFYWFVRLLDDNQASHYLVPYHVVLNWEIQELKYTKAYVNELPFDQLDDVFA